MQGRRLETVTKSGQTYTYTYNADGIRTSKTVDGVKREYILNGTQILGEIWSDGTTIVYIYDAEGYAVGMLYRDSSYEANKFDAFFYERNLQGDVIAVYDCEDTKLVSYTYDAWGNVSITYSNGGDLTGAQYNPFTYRGYYRDSETGFYYLNTRYYDAVIGRFINADEYVSTGQGFTGYNMFAYCGNDPVMRIDICGYAWKEFLEELNAFIKELRENLKNKDGSYSLYDNDRLEDSTLWHSQIFSFNSSFSSPLKGDNKLSASLSADLYTGGWETEHIDASLMDFGHAEVTAKIEDDTVEMGACVSAWSPSISFGIEEAKVEVGAEVGAFGCSIKISKNQISFKVAVGIGFSMNIQW